MTFLVTLRDGTKFKADKPTSREMKAWLKECGYLADYRHRLDIPADRQVVDWHEDVEGVSPAGCPL